MPVCKGRQYRSLTVLGAVIDEKRIDSNYYIEGYATTYQRYKLWDDEEGGVYEQFEPTAFVGCDMSDIIMQYDHEGKVLARQSNKTLIVEPNINGLFICADLSKSAQAQELYQEVSTGLVTKMSWTFSPGDYYYDTKTRTFIHTKVKKIYDVSAVSIPANDTTDIQARSLVNGEISRAMQELQVLQNQKQKLKLKLTLGGF